MKLRFLPKSFRQKKLLLFKFISSLDETRLNLLILVLHNDDYFYRYFPLLSDLDISISPERTNGTSD